MRTRMLLVALAGLAFASQPLARSKKEPATVQCRDGTTAKAGRGACSHHGGVAGKGEVRSEPRREAPATAPERERSGRGEPVRGGARRAGRAPAEPRARPAPAPPAEAGQPTARCRDGSLSYAAHHAGACSSHGGVAEWLDQAR